ncbi:MAG: cytochrome ubiquinol oxidase subunit I [Acidimicrobiales bacterium]|nr:cytochrome ubiquinol oxidase subunit I [Acidimicrobiales bacterium]
MAFSLGWHIVIAAFGVAFPAIIWVVHRRGIRHDDADALILAKRWSKVAGLLFALGAVSGTILSFEMGLLWPGLMGAYGDVIGLPFALEGVSFFLEAIFLGIYLYGWGRLPPRVHLWTLVPIAIAGVAGSFFILSVNGWMNAPSGFTLDGSGDVVDVDPLAAMFNEAVWMQWLHMFLAAYMVVGFLVAAVYAAGMLRGRRDHLHRLGFVVPFAFASVAAVAQPFVGHLTGMRLQDGQPSKLAAMELAVETEDRAPLVIGGLLVDGEARYGIEIPVVGSILAGGSPNAELTGLDDVEEADELPVNVVHTSFQLMVGLGFLMIGIAAWYWIGRRRGGDPLGGRWFLRAAVVAGIAAPVALQAGWVTTEVGRQPWIAYRVLRVDESVTDASWIWLSLTVIVVVYASMTVIAVGLLRAMASRWRRYGGAELRAPYGPPEEAPPSEEPAPVAGGQ